MKYASTFAFVFFGLVGCSSSPSDDTAQGGGQAISGVGGSPAAAPAKGTASSAPTLKDLEGTVAGSWSFDGAMSDGPPALNIRLNADKTDSLTGIQCADSEPNCNDQPDVGSWSITFRGDGAPELVLVYHTGKSDTFLLAVSGTKMTLTDPSSNQALSYSRNSSDQTLQNLGASLMDHWTFSGTASDAPPALSITLNTDKTDSLTGVQCADSDPNCDDQPNVGSWSITFRGDGAPELVLTYHNGKSDTFVLNVSGDTMNLTDPQSKRTFSYTRDH